MLTSNFHREPLAIVGIGCRLPGKIQSPSELWRFLLDRQDGIGEFPPERWSAERFRRPFRCASDRGGFLAEVASFDAEFFGISPREARTMDPQQRLLLEVTYEAFQDAGIGADSWRESQTGVYVGFSHLDYQHLNNHTTVDTHSSTGSAASILANRISYAFHLRGPSLAVDTACSSGLHALHLACTSLWSGECQAAVVGAVSLMLHIGTYVSFSALGMLSPDGQCRAFDADGKGFVRAEGAGVVVLKPLSQALAANDRIYATVLASGLNQDGHSSGLTVPSQLAQEELVRKVYRQAGIPAHKVHYVEAHGTGTPVGDPIEARALGETLGRGRPPGKELWIGSIKTNLGHLEPAAGIAGLIKAALVLKHRQIPANLHFDTPSPNIPFEELRLRVPTAVQDLPSEPLVAGVNSFGFGGANAHVALGEAPRGTRWTTTSSDFTGNLLPLSARSPRALQQMVEGYAQFLRDSPLPLESICATACKRRSHFPYRLLLSGRSKAELVRALEDWSDPPTRGPERPRLAFVFTGQGPQWWGMGRQMLQQEPVFRGVIEKIDGLLRELADWSLLRELSADEASSRMQRTDISQPAVFALQMGLVELLRSWGVEPEAVVGHSMGEVAAACVAGILSLEEATRLIFHRGRCMQATPPGAMVAVGLPAEECQALLADWPRLGLAAYNGPAAVTVSGAAESAAELVRTLESRGVYGRTLPLPYAFHSPHMDGAEEEFRAALGSLRLGRADRLIASSVTGQLATDQDWDTDYQWRNIRQPVQFSSAVERLLDQGLNTFVEIGPSPSLARSLADIVDARGARATIVPTLQRDRHDAVAWSQTLASLYQAGCTLSWEPLYAGPVTPVDLPPYPWQHQDYWCEDPRIRMEQSEPLLHPLLGWKSMSARPAWENELIPAALPYLQEHLLDGEPLLPAAALLEMAMASALWKQGGDGRLGDDQTIVVEGLTIESGFFLLNERGERSLLEADPGHADFAIFQQAGRDWLPRTHGRALIYPRSRASAGPDVLTQLLQRLPLAASGESYYAGLQDAPLWHGPSFRGIVSFACQGDESLVEVRSPQGLEEGYLFHPTLLDACIQGFGPLLLERTRDQYLPASIARFQLFRPPTEHLYSHARLRHFDASEGIFDLHIFTPEGERVAELTGFRFQALGRVAQRQPWEGLLHRFQWEERELPETAAVARDWLVVGRDRDRAGQLCQALQERGHTASPADPAQPRRHPHVLWLGEAGDAPALANLVAWACQAEHTLVVLTREVYGALPNLALAPLWGATRVVASERPGLTTVLIDEGEPADLAALARELGSLEEAEVRLQGSGRQVHRLLPVALSRLAEESARPLEGAENCRLDQSRPGELDSLGLVRFWAEDPGPGQVEVEVAAAALNFSDVLKALGIYPGTPGGALPMGLEFAGTVVRLGEKVAGIALGDRVMGFAPRAGSFTSRMLVPADILVPVPANIDLPAAATLPVAYLTAAYALLHLGRMQAGERVLIHSASGGVGLAAIELARHLGAEPLVTAGSEDKRQFLRGLGLTHVFDSRSLEFADQVLEATEGRGVDLVLNSLAGEAIRAGLRCLAPGGRFLEIGKRDIYGDEPMGLGFFRNNLSFHAIDLEQQVRLQPRRTRELLDSVRALLESGQVAPLPFTSFPMNRAEEAFRLLASATHIGKVLLTAAEPGSPVRAWVPDSRGEHEGGLPPLAVRPEAAPPALRPDACYLVVGGLGGFGLALAGWLLENGAGRVVLASRREASAAALGLPAERVTTVRCDVSEREDVLATVQECRRLGELAGVFHCAMVLDDANLEDLNEERFRTVLRPKVDGAWNLHTATEADPLDHFVLFSSISAVYGGPGQANYCAANVYLDRLAALRRAQGRPGLAVNWSAIADVGYLAERERLRSYLESAGVAPLESARALATLGALMALRAPQVAVAEVDWNRLTDLIGTRSTLTELRRSGTAPAGAASGKLGLDQATPSERRAEIVRLLQNRLAHVLGTTSEEIDPSRPVRELGLDSLMAFELRNWAESTLGLSLPVARLLGQPTLVELADSLAEQWQERQSGEPASTPTPESPAPLPVARPKPAAPSAPVSPRLAAPAPAPVGSVVSSFLSTVPTYPLYQAMEEGARLLRLESPFFRVHQGVAGATTRMDDRELINFASYNYLGLCGHPSVNAAAVEAIQTYGTSVSGSRLVGGERPPHQQLEEHLARFLGTEDCLTLVSGHATNVSTLSHLCGAGDLIVYDELAHDSALQGIAASGAARQLFAHNDLDDLRQVLAEMAARHRKTLVYVEGLYSMDGDFPDLPRLFELQDQYGFLLMIDEAHSIGVMGRTGRGIAEHFGLARDRQGVLWMGTLSKAFASCGGYLAGSHVLLEFLRHTLPTFVYSVGMPPASAAAALASLRVLEREPERVQQLRERSSLLYALLREQGCDLGPCMGGLPVIPVIEGEEERCVRVSQELRAEGVNVVPIIFPAVAPGASRLRFFVTQSHTPEQLRRAAECLARIRAKYGGGGKAPLTPPGDGDQNTHGSQLAGTPLG